MKHGRKEEAIELAMSAIGEPESPYILGEEEVIRNRLSMDLDRLLGAGKENYLPIMNEEEVHAFVEETIEFNGEELTIPVHYAGSVDRGFKTEEGRVAIMELKTGKWMQTKKPMQDEWNDSTYKVQSMRTEMAYYKFLLEAADHDYQDVSHWGWVYPAGKFAEVPTFNKYGNEQRSVDNITYETASGRSALGAVSKASVRLGMVVMTLKSTGIITRRSRHEQSYAEHCHKFYDGKNSW